MVFARSRLKVRSMPEVSFRIFKFFKGCDFGGWSEADKTFLGKGYLRDQIFRESRLAVI
jgi:ABC-type sulfate transport system substrate-binding protein